jgi:radical SAM superfamily enzyme YgiQ (UPF0313 family)
MLKKLRFIEPGNYSLYKPSPLNGLVYNKYIKNPSTGLITLTTIAKGIVPDSLMYSESISTIRYDDVYDADVIFFSINTFNAVRGYKLAEEFRAKSKALLVFGGMHASLNWQETIQHCDFVLTGDGDELLIDFLTALDAGKKIDFPGVIYKENGVVKNSGSRPQPELIDTIPDRNLVYGYSRLAKRYDTLWPQVHASRGCPHSCAYCSVIAHFGRKIRKRSPESVVADIKESIAFHKRAFPPRLNTVVWITDDNFAEDREWATSVLKAMIASGVKYHYSVQARFEIGFDDEILALMKRAGFIELALGIEFVHDDSFTQYHKKSSNAEIVRSIRNIRRHGIGVRGLFIVGADDDRVGIGDDIVRFVKTNRIHGALIQSMFFTPGTPVYESSKDSLIHENWEKYDGNVVHYPKNIKPHELQREIISASAKIYSLGNLLRAILTYRWINKVLFIGEYFWQMSLRKDLRREIPYLKSLPPRTIHARNIFTA